MTPSTRPVRPKAPVIHGIVAAVLAALVLVGSGPVPAGAVPAAEIEPSQTDVDPETDQADGTDSTVAEETETSAAVETVGPAEATTDEGSIVENPLGASEEDQEGSSASEDRKIWAVIGGLLLVAVALTALTVRYWRQTRPAPRPAAAAPAGRRARSAAEPAAYDDLGSDLFVDEP